MKYCLIKLFEDENESLGFYNNKGFPRSPNDMRVFTTFEKAKTTRDFLRSKDWRHEIEIVDEEIAYRFQKEQDDQDAHNYALSCEDDF